MAVALANTDSGNNLAGWSYVPAGLVECKSHGMLLFLMTLSAKLADLLKPARPVVRHQTQALPSRTASQLIHTLRRSRGQLPDVRPDRVRLALQRLHTFSHPEPLVFTPAAPAG